jgi:hypothetical protein
MYPMNMWAVEPVLPSLPACRWALLSYRYSAYCQAAAKPMLRHLQRRLHDIFGSSGVVVAR